ncbi:MAG: SGNH/GDSL hydrolase family protein [Balneolales bacterium]
MDKKEFSRRHFLGLTAASLGSGILLPSMVAGRSATGQAGHFLNVNKGSTILFQGDSITDARRNREDSSPNSLSGLGGGYALLAAGNLRYNLPAHDLQIYNKGISGNKVFELADRWEEDCLQLKPDMVSILVGVNDFWHTLNNTYKGSAEKYENDYRSLLDRTKEALPEVKLVIGEPFVILEGSAITAEAWVPEFARYQAAARRIARDYDAAFIPYQSVFDEASGDVPSVYWTADGVHPTIAGSNLMAHAWLDTVKNL